LTSSVEDSHANPSPLQASDSPKRTSGGFGPSSHDAFAYYDPASRSWRTCQGSFLPEWETYSETWPRSGMTRSGIAYRQPPLVPRTNVTESCLLPTPREIYGEHPGMIDPSHLTGAVHFWPTPKSSPSGPDFARMNREGSGGDDLATAVARETFPTPTVNDAKNNGSASQQRRNTPPLNAVAGGQLNPSFVEWLMGFPQSWTELG
jgi:hypothetical protein